MNSVVDRIFEMLKYRKMSQKGLADKLNIQKNAVTRWKSGELNSYMKYLPAIAKELGTTTEYLLSGNAIYKFPASAEAFREFMARPQVEEEIRQAQQQCTKDQKRPTPVDGDGQGQNVIKIAGRDGSLIERRLTDEQVAALKLMLTQLPEVEDL